MKNHLSAFLLMIFAGLSGCSTTPSEKCKSQFLDLLDSYGMSKEDLKSPKEIIAFKNKAKFDGEWSKFTTLCHNPKFKDCKKCACGWDEETTGCLWNCSCCWGNKWCSETS